ncbi:MAG: DNA-processing protein DprA [Lachnospiraceae bacterium]|nr:DNA-processing protein DprA [Lachnospiraceae bacterium]
MDATNKLYWYWLSKLEIIGPAGRKRLLERFQSPEGIFRATPEAVERFGGLTPKQLQAWMDCEIRAKAAEEFYLLKERDIHFVLKEESGFPMALREIPQAPDFLFYRGRLPEEHKISIAMIGARECSFRGRKIAQELAGELADAGIQIISGMARGVDGVSQKAALQYAPSYAVLGSGVDYCYPPENYALYEELLRRGGILSEYPPGSRPAAFHFPMRNRLIAGLADGLVVVEARKKSGTLITVDFALEQGKQVFAVPGREGEALSEGCNELLLDGAHAATCAKDILEVLAKEYIMPPKTRNNKKNIFLLEEEEKMLYASVSLEPKHPEELLRLTGWAPEKLMQILFSLEMRGLIYSPTGNYYMAK